MKNQLITLFSSFFCYLIFTTTIQAQESIFDKLDSIAIVDEKVMMPMRDGVRLASDIYRPKGAGKYPIIFLELHTILILGEMVSKELERLNVPTNM